MAGSYLTHLPAPIGMVKAVTLILFVVSGGVVRDSILEVKRE